MSKNQCRKEFTRDGTIPVDASDGVVALRMFFEDPDSIVKFAEFAKRREKLQLLLCWLEVLEYKKIEGGNGYKLSQANLIYHKYYKEDAVVQLGSLQSARSSTERDDIKHDLDYAEKDHDVSLPPKMFDKFGQDCLLLIYEEVYKSYRQSFFYQFTLNTMRKQANCVGLDDFEYKEFLGQGSFGMVVHCVKKSTGKHYAMKIQTKVGLLQTFADDPKRVTHEKEALVKCHHPFIISMDYAFQTPELAIMVTSLGTGESLRFPEPIPEEHAIFYAAEIVLALNHIHSMEMIYRDLKPSNVLLNADGHIQLVDMGGVVDVGGRTLGVCSDTDLPEAEGAALFGASSGATTMSIYAPGAKSISLRHPAPRGGCNSGTISEYGPSVARNECSTRANSIMGTSGYMAPEMLAMLRMEDQEDMKGYTYAVDYWSLGVLIYVLVVGSLPFVNDDVVDFGAYISVDDGEGHQVNHPSYAQFRRALAALTHVSESFKQIVVDLLTIDEKKRLGSGSVSQVKNHAWFRQNEFGVMPWSLLGKKLVKPPGSSDAGAVPNIVDMGSYDSFQDMLLDTGAGGLVDWVPDEVQQTHFDTWDYVAPYVLKVEVGAEEEEQKHTSSLQQVAGMGQFGFSMKMSEYSGRDVSVSSVVFGTLGSSLSGSGKTSRKNSVVAPGSPKFQDRKQSSFGTTKDAASIATVGQQIKALE